MKKQIVSMKRGAQKGFTLIELMIVIAIIGILAAFAVPMFQDYTVRTRAAEGLVLASTYKNLVVDNATNGLPFKNGEPTFIATDNTSSITVDQASGKITIIGTAKAGALTLVLTPSTGAAGANPLVGTATGSTIPTGRIGWKCTTTATNKNQVPAECR